MLIHGLISHPHT